MADRNITQIADTQANIIAGLNDHQIAIVNDGYGELIWRDGDQINFPWIQRDVNVSDDSRTYNDLGVGTETPERPLHIKVSDVVGPFSGYSQLLLERNSNNYIQFLSGAASAAGIIFGDAGSENAGGIYYDQGTDHMKFWANGAERVRIAPTGNVGIKTDAPDTLLHIFSSDSTGTPAADALLTLENSSSLGLQFLSQGSGVYQSIYFGDDSDNDIGMIRYRQFSNYMTFTTNAAEAMRIDENQNVSIGTTDTAVAKLEVRGNIQMFNDSEANTILKIKATGGWDSQIQLIDGATNLTWYLYQDDSADNNFVLQRDGLIISRITTAGNIGIGTKAVPETLLNLYADNPILLIQDKETGTAGCDARLRIAESGGSEAFGNYADIRINAQDVDTSRLALRLGFNDTDYVTIEDYTGRVGIGTTAPDQLLHVSHATTGAALRFESRDTTVSNNQVFGTIEFESLDTDASAGGVRSCITGTAAASKGGAGASAIRFHVTDPSDTTLYETLRLESTDTANRRIVIGDDTDVYSDSYQDYSSSVITGWSGTTTSFVAYKRIGKTVWVNFFISGTSDTTTVNFTLPYTNNTATHAQVQIPIRTRDNSGAVTGYASLNANTSTVNCFSNYLAGAWTASGLKEVAGQFYYQAVL